MYNASKNKCTRKKLWWWKKLKDLFIEDDDLLEKYKSICNKVSNIINKEPICNKKFLKSKISSYSDEITNFHKKPKVGSNYPCLAVLLIDFVLKRDENYYPQVFLKKCKYTEKEKKKGLLMT